MGRLRDGCGHRRRGRYTGVARLLSALAAFVSAGALLVSAPTVQAADDQVLSLRQAVAGLSVAAEDRTGYDRDLFRHWVGGQHPVMPLD